VSILPIIYFLVVFDCITQLVCNNREKVLHGHRTKKWYLVTTNHIMTPHKDSRERKIVIKIK